VIEAAELRGALNRLSSIKPYTRAQVSELLATIQGQLGLFSQMEREEIARLAAEFSAGSKGDIGRRSGGLRTIGPPWAPISRLPGAWMWPGWRILSRAA
jgi:hypothetical protein